MRRMLRVRGRNQITIPAQIVERLGLVEDDFLYVTLNEEALTVTLQPARLAVAGTQEAEREAQNAKEDFATGRVQRFESPRLYAENLRKRGEQAAGAMLKQDSEDAAETAVGAAAARSMRAGRSVESDIALAQEALERIRSRMERLEGTESASLNK